MTNCHNIRTRFKKGFRLLAEQLKIKFEKIKETLKEFYEDNFFSEYLTSEELFITRVLYLKKIYIEKSLKDINTLILGGIYITIEKIQKDNGVLYKSKY